MSEETQQNPETAPVAAVAKYGKVLKFPEGEWTAKSVAELNSVSPSFVHGYLKHRLSGKYRLVKQVKGGRGKPASVFTLN